MLHCALIQRRVLIRLARDGAGSHCEESRASRDGKAISSNDAASAEEIDHQEMGSPLCEAPASKQAVPRSMELWPDQVQVAVQEGLQCPSAAVRGERRTGKGAQRINAFPPPAGVRP